MLSDKAIIEFQLIYKKEYGITLSKEEAMKKALKLLTLIKAIYKPIIKR